MKFSSVVLILALVAVALVWTPTAAASSLVPEVAPSESPAVEIQETTASSCDAGLAFDSSPAFEPTPQAATGCSESQCDKSCRLQGYDYGVCFWNDCICRFWYP